MGRNEEIKIGETFLSLLKSSFKFISRENFGPEWNGLSRTEKRLFTVLFQFCCILKIVFVGKLHWQTLSKSREICDFWQKSLFQSFDGFVTEESSQQKGLEEKFHWQTLEADHFSSGHRSIQCSVVTKNKSFSFLKSSVGKTWMLGVVYIWIVFNKSDCCIHWIHQPLSSGYTGSTWLCSHHKYIEKTIALFL